MQGSIFFPGVVDRKYVVFAGRYFDRPDWCKGVRLTAEMQMASDIALPIPDFKVPTRPQLIAAIAKTLTLMLLRKPVYVGCAGGKGRTGLFLAAIAKLWGAEDPIKYVRDRYLKSAVESGMQEGYLEALTFPLWLKLYVLVLRAASLLTSKANIPSVDSVLVNAALEKGKSFGFPPGFWAGQSGPYGYAVPKMQYPLPDKGPWVGPPFQQEVGQPATPYVPVAPLAPSEPRTEAIVLVPKTEGTSIVSTPELTTNPGLDKKE